MISDLIGRARLHRETSAGKAKDGLVFLPLVHAAVLAMVPSWFSVAHIKEEGSSQLLRSSVDQFARDALGRRQLGCRSHGCAWSWRTWVSASAGEGDVHVFPATIDVSRPSQRLANALLCSGVHEHASRLQVRTSSDDPTLIVVEENAIVVPSYRLVHLVSVEVICL